jgi:hypothetical protein
MTDRTPTLSHVKARIRREKKYNNEEGFEGSLVANFPVTGGTIPYNFDMTILTCSIDQPRPS